MPPKQTTYTNADLTRFDHHPIPDQIGPWVTVGKDGVPQKPKSSVDEQDYDPFAALENAKRWLAEDGKHELVSSHGPTAPDGRNHTLDTVNEMASAMFGDAGKGDSGLTRLRKSAQTIAAPAMMVGGPIGALADADFAGEAANNFREDPGVLNGLMLALGVIPGVNAARGAMKSAKEAKAIDLIRRTQGAGDMGATFSRETPYRAGSGVSSDAPVSMGDLANSPPPTMLQRARGQVSDFLSGLGRKAEMPTPPAAPQQVMPASAKALMELPGEDSPGLRQMVEDTNTAEVGPRLGIRQDVDGPESALVDALIHGRAENWPRYEPMTPAGIGEHSVYPPKVGGRTGNMHGAQTTGGMYGFDNLPKISEAELSRLQASFNKVK
jgi:hypothetical protein